MTFTFPSRRSWSDVFSSTHRPVFVREILAQWEIHLKTFNIPVVQYLSLGLALVDAKLQSTYDNLNLQPTLYSVTPDTFWDVSTDPFPVTCVAWCRMATQQIRPKLRILCLHGRCQTAATFQTKLERLRQKSAHFADFVFLVDARKMEIDKLKMLK